MAIRRRRRRKHARGLHRPGLSGRRYRQGAAADPVTAVSYRPPGLLAKWSAPSTPCPAAAPDSASAWASMRPKPPASACPSAPVAERFEQLEETLQICLQIWSGDDGPCSGRHYQLGRTLDAPQPLSRPHPYRSSPAGANARPFGSSPNTRTAATSSAPATTPAAPLTCCTTLRHPRPQLRRHRQDNDDVNRAHHRTASAARPAARRPRRRTSPPPTSGPATPNPSLPSTSLPKSSRRGCQTNGVTGIR